MHRLRLGAVVLMAAVVALTGCSSGSTSNQSGSSVPAASSDRLNLKGACPAKIVIQTDWDPESEYGVYYYLLGPDYKMGNIRDASMTEIWEGPKAKEIRHRLKSEKFCDVCTNNCDLLNNLKEETWSFASYMLQHPQTFSRLLQEIKEKDHLRKYAGGRVKIPAAQ